jgi:hypothetical protein
MSEANHRVGWHPKTEDTKSNGRATAVDAVWFPEVSGAAVTREQFHRRFQSWFMRRLPGLRTTARDCVYDRRAIHHVLKQQANGSGHELRQAVPVDDVRAANLTA